MAVKVEISFCRTVESPWELPKAFAFLRDYEKSVGGYFPKIQQFVREAGETYRWVFQPVEQGGFKIDIAFSTEFLVKSPDTINIKPAAGKGNHRLSGKFKLEPTAMGCRLHINFNFETELPLPFLLKAVVVPVTQKEISMLFERYASNVGKAISA